MTQQHCVTTETGCVVCDALAAIPYTPPSATTLPGIGWNAGADSADTIDGDLHLVFTMGQVVGAICGFKSARTIVGSPVAINYGFGFFAAESLLIFYIVENGYTVFDGAPYSPGDTFEIRRQGQFVTYWQNDTRIYTSTRPSYGPLFVSACEYVAGDTIG